MITNPPKTIQLQTPDGLNQIVIRPAIPADLPLMEWEGEYRHFRRLYQSAYERSLAGLCVLWVVELPGSGLIGQVFIQLDCDRPELADGQHRAYLYGFRVRPLYRNLGIGTLLFQTAEKDLLQRGYQSMTLNVAKENLNAIRLYNRLNFLIVAFEPGVWSYQDEDGHWHTMKEPGWRMEKRLTNK